MKIKEYIIQIRFDYEHFSTYTSPDMININFQYLYMRVFATSAAAAEQVAISILTEYDIANFNKLDDESITILVKPA